MADAGDGLKKAAKKGRPTTLRAGRPASENSLEAYQRLVDIMDRQELADKLEAVHATDYDGFMEMGHHLVVALAKGSLELDVGAEIRRTIEMMILARQSQDRREQVAEHGPSNNLTLVQVLQQAQLGTAEVPQVTAKYATVIEPIEVKSAENDG